MVRPSEVARELGANFLLGFGPFRKWRMRSCRTMSNDLNDQTKQIWDQFEFFMTKIGWGNVKGRVIVEIGPGDSIPLGLLFLGAGARQYVAIDRFAGNVAGVSAQGLYAALVESAPKELREGWSYFDIDSARYPVLEPSRVELIHQSVEEVMTRDKIEFADIIISYNVVEHLQNVEAAFLNMAIMLKSDGQMIHRVDYGPHGVWRNCVNPMEFLTVARVLWNMMGSNRGYPNRLRHSQVLQALEKCDFQNNDRAWGHIATNEIESVRSRLPTEQRYLSDSSLMVKDAEIVSTKRRRQGS